MGLKIDGLSTISQLSKGDQILVATKDGLKSLSAEVLEAVFSNTSLFETYNLVELSNLNVQNISTHNKVRKYLKSDISPEVYIEYTSGQVNVIKATVLTDTDGNPLTAQASDLRGNLLYWSEEITLAEYFDGLPWKNAKDEKIYMTTEETEFPVTVYQYSAQYLKQSKVTQDSKGNPVITDTFTTAGTSKGIVEKRENSFLIQLQEKGKDPCGLQISLNKDGTVTGKLVGTWEGVNDWDIDDVIKKPEFKEWFYHNLDYNMYANVLSVNTADMIGWCLNNDTNNHVIAEVNEGIIRIYLAQNKVSGAGTYIQEQAKNKFGDLLYWKEDMTYQSGVNGEHIPIHNGEFAFMTTEETDYPVFIYQYNYIPLFTMETEDADDGTRATILKFAGVNGKLGEIYKNSSQFVMRYLDSKGKEYSKIVLGETESELTGKWKSGSRVLSENELPIQSASTKDKMLMSSGTNAQWTSLGETEVIKNLIERIEELEQKIEDLTKPVEPTGES